MTLSSYLQWLQDNMSAIIAGVIGVIASASMLIKALEALAALFVAIFPGLKAVDGKLQGLAAWLDGLAKAPFLNALALTPKHAKTLLVLLVLGLGLSAAPARASGLDWSWGPSIQFLEFDFGNPQPIQVAPGAGVQASVTLDSLKFAAFGKSWDGVSLYGAAFGSLIKQGTAPQMGALSVVLGPCFLSSLACVGFGRHLLATDESLVSGNSAWLVSLSLNFNWAIGPEAPPVGIAAGPRGMVRANTIYFGSK